METGTASRRASAVRRFCTTVEIARAGARELLSIRMLVATVAVGGAAGVAGIALTLVLHGVQHLAFGYTENTFLVGVERATPARRVLAVGAGGLVVGLGWWLFHRRTPVRPSVTAALRGDHRLPVLSSTVDAVLQVVAVAAGASLGREGAPRQVGAAVAGRIAAVMGVARVDAARCWPAGPGRDLRPSTTCPSAEPPSRWRFCSPRRR